MNKMLVTYFSASGVTRKAAEKLSEAAGADLYEIRPAVPYTAADLDWMDASSRSSKEMKGKAPYPELADTSADIEDRDVIAVCFPIWWYTVPTIINRFLESYDFSGKKIFLFATSGGSGFGKTAKDLKKSAPGAEIVEGRMLNGNPTVEELAAWIEKAK